MAMAILRTAKLKSLGNVAASLSHNYRTRETHNADPQRYDTNTLERSPQAVLDDLKAKLPDKRRKDAVLCIEYMVSASPEWFQGKSKQEQDAYFAQTKQWLIERHGAGNLLDFSIHRDEKSPHAVAYVVPLDEGKLNAKKWLGGRATLSAMQTDFAKRVGHGHGLERGVEGSKAKHTTVKEFYASVNASEKKMVSLNPEMLEPKLLEKGFIRSSYESPEMVASRVSDAVNRHFSPVIKKAEEADLKGRREADKDRTIKALSKQRTKAIEALKLLRKEFSDLLKLAEHYPKAYVQMQELTKAVLERESQRQAQEKVSQEKSAPGRSRSRDGGFER